MSISRRELFSGVCAAGTVGLFGGCTQQLSREIQSGRPGRPFSFVHLTDQHVTHRRHGEEGYRRCIASINALRPKPAFVLMGGDMVWDGNYTDRDVFESCITLFKNVTGELEMPWYPCMGNHDTLGLSERRKVPVTDPEFGKKMIMNRLGWEKSYYSFDHGGWHFVVLDSTFEKQTNKGPSEEARIGPEQLDWLGYDLGAAAGRPTIVVTHVAAFCNIGQINGDAKRVSVDGGMVLWDTRELRRILERHKVKALLQGHSHTIEEYRFDDVWYLTSAAGSGSWWAGSWVGSPQGYTVFTCDGDQLTWKHITFPLNIQLDANDNLERRKLAEQAIDRDYESRVLYAEQHHLPRPKPPATAPASAPATSPALTPGSPRRGGGRHRRSGVSTAVSPTASGPGDPSAGVGH